MPGALETLLRQAPLSDDKLAFVWRSIVGKALDRVTTVRLGGPATLVVDVRDERWRVEIARAEPRILERLARVLGRDAIRRLRIVVDTRAQRAFRW
jgi:hypothetical protein